MEPKTLTITRFDRDWSKHVKEFLQGASIGDIIYAPNTFMALECRKFIGTLPGAPVVSVRVKGGENGGS
jgi:hypothetical protein